MKKALTIVVLIGLLFSCQDEKKKNIEVKQESYSIPTLHADSAYEYIARQVAFGPRVPGMESHAKCADWLEEKLASFGIATEVQAFEAKRFDGVPISGKNIIGKINPDAKKRVFLCAHWDSRFKADYDDEDKESPIAGADDGASGVGLAMEVARVLQASKDFKMGLDIVFFDAEDQGNDDGAPESWGIGAQRWSNAYKSGYNPRYGILLDMVGAKDAVFFRERYSMQTAPNVVFKIWKIAEDLGYSDLFRQQDGRGVVDDHYFINQNAGWPVADIIHTKQTTNGTGFGEHWHTHDDDMDVIDKNTLKRVGKVIIHTLCREDQGR